MKMKYLMFIKKSLLKLKTKPDLTGLHKVKPHRSSKPVRPKIKIK